MCESRGGEGGFGGEATGFLSITGPDPWKIIKLPSKHSMLGHHWPTSETPFCHFNGIWLVGR